MYGTKTQFIIKKEEPTVLACWARYDKKTLSRQVIPLAWGYQTALLSCPVLTPIIIRIFKKNIGWVMEYNLKVVKH